MMFSHATSPSGKALRMPGQQQKQPHDAPATEQQRPSKGSSSRLVGGGKQRLYNESIGGGGGGGGGGRVERCMQCAKLGSAAVFVVAVSCFALQYRAATATVTATFARLDAEPSVFDCGAVGGTHPVGIARADSGNFCCAGRCGDECGQSNCTRRFSERECCGSSISRVGAYCDGNWPAPCIPFRPRDPAEWTEAEVLPAPASQHCIVTSAAGVFQESMLKSTSGANSDYAARHGYTYIELKDSAVHNLHGKNAKFQIILDSFVTHECLWVLWMDPEAEVITPTVKLEDIVAQFRGPAFIFGEGREDSCPGCCSDKLSNQVSGSVLFVKNTPVAADVLGRALAVNLVTVGLEEGKEPGWCTQDEMVMAPHTAPRPRFQSNCALSLVVNKLDMEAVRCHTGGLQCWGKNYTQYSECNRAGGGAYLFRHDGDYLAYHNFRCQEVAAEHGVGDGNKVVAMCKARLEACAKGEWFCRWYRDTHSDQELGALGLKSWDTIH